MNTIDLPVSELKTILTGLGKVVSRKSTLPVLQHIRVSRDDKGSVSLQATDLDTFVTYHVPDAQPGPTVDLLMPLEQLTNAVKSSSAKDTFSLVMDTKQAKIRYSLAGSPVEQSVETLPVNEWPPAPEVNQPATAFDREFGSALKQALECCSNDPTRYILRGACLDVTDKKFHYVVGTNGRMLYSANSFCFDLQKSVVIPDSKFLTASDFLNQEGGLLSVVAGKDVNWVKLQSPRWTYLSKQIEGNYPNWKQVVPTSSSTTSKILLNDAALKQLLTVAPKLPGDRDQNRPIRIRFDLQSVFIEGRSKDQKEWTSIPLPEAVARGRQVSVTLDREYLLKAVRFGLRQMEIEDELSPVIFGNAGRKMIVMPLRPDASPASTAPTPPPVGKPTASTNSEPSETKTNERKTMQSTTTLPQRGNLETNGNGSHEARTSALRSALEEVEQLRTSLRDLVVQVGDVAAVLKAAEKEQRGATKEFESVRSTLRSLQKVVI